MSLFNVPWLIDDEFSPQEEGGGTTYDITVSGGIVFGNTAAPQCTYNPGSTGGIVFGSSTGHAVYNPSVSGGIVFGGSAEVSVAVAVSGGIRFGSTAATQNT